MNYFVTGTDTGVGKTLIACALLHAFAAQGRHVIGMKPIAAGCDDNGVNEDVSQLLAASNVNIRPQDINPYCFPQFMAPHIAAKNADVRIEFAPILAAYQKLAAQSDVVIVEGVGGFRVPLNASQDSADLAIQMKLPVILVVGMRLGCLNHALLTLRAISECGLSCAGWVANVLDDEMPALPENIEALQQRITAPLLGVMPHQSQLDVPTAARHLNIALLRLDAPDNRTSETGA